MNQVSLHKIIKASPEKIFKAFSNSQAYSSWIPPYGFLCSIQEYDFKIGGRFKMTFTNFSTGNGHSFGGEFVEIIDNEFLKMTDKFDDPNLTSVITTSICLKKVIGGSEIKILQENIPIAIPTEMCYLGWQDSLDKLTRLVEPEIPEG